MRYFQIYLNRLILHECIFFSQYIFYHGSCGLVVLDHISDKSNKSGLYSVIRKIFVRQVIWLLSAGQLSKDNATEASANIWVSAEKFYLIWKFL
jgi:hypothetical protein